MRNISEVRLAESFTQIGEQIAQLLLKETKSLHQSHL